MPNWDDDGPDFHGGGDGWGPCFCDECRAESAKRKAESDRYEAKTQVWADDLGISLDLTTDIGLRNGWEMFCGDGPLLLECECCGMRHLRAKSAEYCPNCASSMKVIRRILRSEVPRS